MACGGEEVERQSPSIVRNSTRSCLVDYDIVTAVFGSFLFFGLAHSPKGKLL